MPTAQDPQYASPATSGQLRRSRYLSDALKSMGARSKEVYNTALGTNASILEQAILGYARNNADEKAEVGLKADRVKLADAVLGNLPDTPTAAQVQATTQQQLGGNGAFDLTPAGFDQRNTTGGLQTQARGIFDATGDIGAALQFGIGQQRQAIEDKRYEQERKDKLRTPFALAKGANAIADPDGDGIWESIFDNPDPTAIAPSSKIHSVVIADDRTPYAIAQDMSAHPLGFKALDNFTMADVGGVQTPVSTRTGTPGGALTTPQQVGDNKATINDITKKGEAATQAAIDLPTQIANANNAISIIDGLIAHPKAPSRYGARGVLPPIPGEEAAAQAYIDQIAGAAFLEAYDSLKGGGNIATPEGVKATQAKTRLMNQWQDWASAKKAAQELREIISNGLLRARVKAGQIDLSTLTDAQLDILEGK